MASSDMTATLRNEERLLEATDWRAVVRRRPLTALLCAGAVGFLIARLEIARRKDER